MRGAAAIAIALVTAAAAASAQGPAPPALASALAPASPLASAAAPASPPADAGAPERVNGCVENIPRGADRPFVTENFPGRGTSGWAATLQITVRHGKGERVMPNGLDLSAAQEAKKYLRDAGFAIPDQDGGAAAQIWTDPGADKGGREAVTHLDLPLVLLPPQPGRQVLHLPPLPVAVARANGEIATICTHPHVIGVEDPIAETPNARPKENPPPRPQREEWTALKKAVLYGGLGLVAGALLAWLAYKRLTKPKPPPPPPPPRPPWETALERLDEVRHAGLLENRRHSEYFDRVSDAVRGYLGARFGFDGLESTTDEMLAALRKQASGFVRVEKDEVQASGDALPMPGVPLKEIERFLFECDLVKFANLTPTPEQCATAITAGEHIVRATMPYGLSSAKRATAPEPPKTSPDAEPNPEPKPDAKPPEAPP